MKLPFEFKEHTADVQMIAYGNNIPELFKHALIGMFTFMRPDPLHSGCVWKDTHLVCTELPIKHHLILTDLDLSALLVNFLSEALTLSDIHNEAYLDAALIFNDGRVEGTIFGIVIKRFEGCEIKAVTYHQLEIRHEEDQLEAFIVFDI